MPAPPRPLLPLAARFGLVGAAATALHAALFALLIEGLGWNAPVGATAVAFLAATAFSYLANHGWSFRAEGAHGRYLPRFLLVAGGLFLSSLGIMHGTTALLGLSPWIGLAAVLAVIPPASFLLSCAWTFRAAEA